MPLVENAYNQVKSIGGDLNIPMINGIAKIIEVANGKLDKAPTDLTKTSGSPPKGQLNDAINLSLNIITSNKNINTYVSTIKSVDDSIQQSAININKNTDENLKLAGIKNTDISTLVSKSASYLKQALEIQKTVNSKVSNYATHKLTDLSASIDKMYTDYKDLDNTTNDLQKLADVLYRLTGTSPVTTTAGLTEITNTYNKIKGMIGSTDSRNPETIYGNKNLVQTRIFQWSLLAMRTQQCKPMSLSR